MKNMGTADRVIRGTIAVVIAIAYFAGAISGTVAIILGILVPRLLISGSVVPDDVDVDDKDEDEDLFDS